MLCFYEYLVLIGRYRGGEVGLPTFKLCNVKQYFHYLGALVKPPIKWRPPSNCYKIDSFTETKIGYLFILSF